MEGLKEFLKRNAPILIALALVLVPAALGWAGDDGGITDTSLVDTSKRGFGFALWAIFIVFFIIGVALIGWGWMGLGNDQPGQGKGKQFAKIVAGVGVIVSTFLGAAGYKYLKAKGASDVATVISQDAQSPDQLFESQ